MRPLSRSLLRYGMIGSGLVLVLLVFVFLPRVFGEDQSDVRLAEQVSAVTNSIRQEIQRQDQKHAAEVRRLQNLRQSLQAAGQTARVEEVDRALAEARQEHSARTNALRRWLAAMESSGGSGVSSELDQVGDALRRMNQGFAVAPVISGSAVSGGSYYVDRIDEPSLADEQTGADKDQAARRPEDHVVLPAPLLLKHRSDVRTRRADAEEPSTETAAADRHGHTDRVPDWLYREPPRDVQITHDQAVEVRDMLKNLSEQVSRLQSELKALKEGANKP